MDKNVPCYGCEKRHVEHGYNCHSDCPEYKEFHEERVAKIAQIRHKKNEEAMVKEIHIRAAQKIQKKKRTKSYWKG